MKEYDNDLRRIALRTINVVIIAVLILTADPSTDFLMEEIKKRVEIREVSFKELRKETLD